MEYKNLNQDVRIPVLGMGTWKIGGQLEPVYDNDQRDVAAIKQGIALGLTHIDTAEKYAGGHAEELVGKAIEGINRESLFITTKVARDHCDYQEVLKAMDRSLKRLGISYVDLFLIHAPSEAVPLHQTMKAMNELIAEGKTRYIGVSNFSVTQLKEAQKYSVNPIVANEIEYNLATRNNGQYTTNVESEILPYCQENNIMVIAYRPLAKGMLVNQKNDLLDTLSKKYNKTPAQVALNWLISKDRVVAITKSSTKEHLKEAVGAIGWRMDASDMQLLDNTPIHVPNG